MGNATEAKKALLNYNKSGPQSSENVTPKKSAMRENIDQCFVKFNSLSEDLDLMKEKSDMDTGYISSLTYQIQELQNAAKTNEKRLNLCTGNSEEPITLHSTNMTPELYNLGSTLHLYDAGMVITVNPNTWKTPLSHYRKLVDILGSTPYNDYIEDMIQLPPQEIAGTVRYPVNVRYTNPLKRALGVQTFTSYCNSKDISYPVQYSVNNFPQLKHNLHAMSTILKGLQSEGKIEFYSMNNFMAINDMEYIAPMYIIKVAGQEQTTSYRKCYSNNLFHSGLSVPVEDKDLTSDSFLTLKDAICSQVDDVPKIATWADIVKVDTEKFIDQVIELEEGEVVAGTSDDTVEIQEKTSSAAEKSSSDVEEQKLTIDDIIIRKNNSHNKQRLKNQSRHMYEKQNMYNRKKPKSPAKTVSFPKTPPPPHTGTPSLYHDTHTPMQANSSSPYSTPPPHYLAKNNLYTNNQHIYGTHRFDYNNFSHASSTNQGFNNFYTSNYPIQGPHGYYPAYSHSSPTQNRSTAWGYQQNGHNYDLGPMTRWSQGSPIRSWNTSPIISYPSPGSNDYRLQIAATMAR